jgi:hypothetical protein
LIVAFVFVVTAVSRAPESTSVEKNPESAEELHGYTTSSLADPCENPRERNRKQLRTGMVVIGGGPTATIAESSTVKVVAVAAAAATLASNAANMTSDDKSASAPAPLAAGASTQQKGWNMKNLGQRVAVDAMSAATAGGLVAPIVSMIDK